MNELSYKLVISMTYPRLIPSHLICSCSNLFSSAATFFASSFCFSFSKSSAFLRSISCWRCFSFSEFFKNSNLCLSTSSAAFFLASSSFLCCSSVSSFFLSKSFFSSSILARRTCSSFLLFISSCSLASLSFSLWLANCSCLSRSSNLVVKKNQINKKI